MVCGLQLNFKIDLQLGGEELFGKKEYLCCWI